jgi:surface protein
MGFTKVRVDGEVKDIEKGMKLDRYKIHDIDIVIDRLQIQSSDRKRIYDSVITAMRHGGKTMMIMDFESGAVRHFSRLLMCPTSGISYPEPEPNLFSFNSPYGACTTCKGLGEVSEMDTDKIIPDPKKSIKKGGFAPLGEYKRTWIFEKLDAFLIQEGFIDKNNFTAMFGIYWTVSTPWQTMSGSFNNGGSPSIGNWDTSKVTSFNSMFTGQLSFNQNIGSWNVGKVTTFQNLFSVFNPTPAFSSSLFTFNNGGSDSINNWNLTSSTRIDVMFRDAGNFNQPIGNWNVSNITNFANFMTNKTFNDYSVANYDALLNGWASRPVISGRSINFGTIKYSAAASASRAILTSAPNSWTIVDGGQV